MKKLKQLAIYISFVLVFFIIYFLQANFFNWFTIAGIMPNLFVILVLFIGLFAGKIKGLLYGILFGIILDSAIGRKIGINIVALPIVGVIAGIFDKNFSKDSRITIMVMVFGSTICYEVIVYILNYLLFETNLEIINFIKILAIEVIYNVIITIIIYPLIQKIGYLIENELKENKILTKYF